MAYTNIDKPSDYFNTVLWTGNDSSSNAITGVNFQPDFLWEKQRNKIDNHQLFDSVRGVSKRLISNSTSAETTPSFISSFDSDGFTISTTDNSINSSSYNYVGWSWKAGGTAVSNTQGSITSQVSANQTAGFSIVSYTGTGANASIGHGLNSVPKFIVVKCRSNTMNWPTYNANAIYGVSGISFLDVTDAEANYGTSYWQQTPTSSLFYVGSNTNTNNSGYTYVAYCWSEVKGFSKFGSYVGNGSTDGTFIYTGFKPAFVMIKASSLAGENWYLIDSTRSTYNPSILYLSPNNSGAEASPGSGQFFDFLSNGFKLRVSGSYSNSSGATYIYMAFAESPFTTSTGIPTTAR